MSMYLDDLLNIDDTYFDGTFVWSHKFTHLNFN